MQLDSNEHDLFGRPVTEVRAAVEQHEAALKKLVQLMPNVMYSLPDSEWANYMERVKLYGEEAALTWLISKHGSE